MKTRKYKRIFLIVVDSFGAGEAKDAAEYGDKGADTLGHISQSVGTLAIPNLQRLGIANLHPLKQVEPFGDTVLDALKNQGLDVISIGKINDIFAGRGITEALKSKSSVHGMEQTIDEAKSHGFHGLCFVNLVDFDALWGHRRNPAGYAKELERFDEKLGELLPLLREDDLLMITADHGNDPTYTGTDHTREKAPLLIYSPGMKGSGALPETDSFAAAGATVAENFGVSMPEGTVGESLFGEI